uniref:Sarcolemmal membrane-associated protein n=1 Tax=Romanomermis culicivorax TaxID=13658 RepID=A0A915ICW6_ROMCU
MEVDLAGNSGNCAYAVFTPCQQSHPFEDRRIPFAEEQIKIGRAVAKLKPGSNNAIFDCKVLSRNHAVMWFENGRFFLKDTKSSNGTFVNNQRLSKGTEESTPKEIFSGDIVQFGVEIVENTKKVTHGCIISIARLYFPDGREASSRSEFDTTYANLSTSSAASHCLQSALPFSAINSQELYQLQQYIKEAVYREQLIESKLSTLQNLLSATQEASENSWRALIDEDRLLSRIEMLEGQLLAFSKNMNEDKLREQIIQLQEEKEKYELSGKEALRRALQEKMEAVQRLSDVERSLETTEEECAHLRESRAMASNEVKSLSDQNNDFQRRLNSLAQQLEEAEQRYKEMDQCLTAEKLELESRLVQVSNRDLYPQKVCSPYPEVATQLNGIDAKVEAISKFENDHQEEEEENNNKESRVSFQDIAQINCNLSEIVPPRTNLIHEKLKEQIVQLVKEKEICELKGKEEFQRVYEEKMETINRLQNVETDLKCVEQECMHLKELYASARSENKSISEKCSRALADMEILTDLLKESEQKRSILEEHPTVNNSYSQSSMPFSDEEESVKDIKADTSSNGTAGCSRISSDESTEKDSEEKIDNNFGWDDIMLQIRTIRQLDNSEVPLAQAPACSQQALENPLGDPTNVKIMGSWNNSMNLVFHKRIGGDIRGIHCTNSDGCKVSELLHFALPKHL